MMSMNIWMPMAKMAQTILLNFQLLISRRREKHYKTIKQKYKCNRLKNLINIQMVKAKIQEIKNS